MTKKYNDLIILSIIVLLGAILRLNHFTLLALWNDEAYSANILSNNYLNLWSATFWTANNPTFIYCLKIWSDLFGTSVLALRAMSIFFSLVSIIAINYLGKLLFGRKAGLWASFLLAVNYLSIFYSNEARPYSLLILLTILSYYFFSRIILDQKKKRTIFCYVFFTTLGLYIHPWFFFLLPAQFITALIIKRKEAKNIILWQFVCLAFSLPLLYELSRLVAVGENTWIPIPTIKTLLETFNYFSYGAQIIYILIIVLIPGYLLFKRIKIKGTNFFIALNLLIIPLFLGFFISKFFPMYFPGRHEAEVLVGFILVSGYLMSKITSKLLYFIIIFILMFSAFFMVAKERKEILLYKTDEKRAAEFLVNNVSDNDLLVFMNLNKNTFEYYLPRLDRSKNFFKIYFPMNSLDEPNFQINNYFPKKSYEYVQSVIQNNKFKNIWVVYDSTRPLDREFIAKFRTGMILVNRFEFVKTDNYYQLNSILPMFFDYIEQYKY